MESRLAPLDVTPLGFSAPPGYLSACTGGLPTAATARALRGFVDDWTAAAVDAVAISAQVEACRAAYAGIVGVRPDRVAVGSQVSQLASIVATAVPDGAEVVCAAGDFASLTHPFEQAAARGVRVRYVPVAALPDEIGAATALVAYSLVQSATGEVADAAAIREAAARVGARTCVDLTQATGWLPVDAGSDDFTLCHAYKWLCAPRGVTFLTVRDGLDDTLTPLAAGWCSADDPWGSCYAGHTPLATGAGRFDLSPAWPVIGGTLAALTDLASLDPAAVYAHDTGLAASARTALGVPEPRAGAASAIVTWADPDGHDLDRLRAAGITASGRAGNARISFHLWNTLDDVERLEHALR